MVNFNQVIVLEVESAKDKNKETEGGKYRRDSPWLVQAFLNRGYSSKIIFISNKDTADSLIKEYPDTAFLGRVNPMDYEEIRLSEYIKMLEELQQAGVLLGPDPDLMNRLGSKMIVYELRDTAMGTNDILLHKYEDMKNSSAEIDVILPPKGPSRVLKMMRGSTGLGVWKLENLDDNLVLVTDAYTQNTEQTTRAEVIPKFLSLCQEDAISMPFMPLIKDGEFRFLLSRHEVLDVIHKRPVDSTAFTATLRSGAIYTTLKPEENREMIDAIVQWSKEIKSILDIPDVPYWWSVDCIEAEKNDDNVRENVIPSSNPGKYLVLSEINCSCLGLVADTSPEAQQKGMKYAEMIANIILPEKN